LPLILLVPATRRINALLETAVAILRGLMRSHRVTMKAELRSY